LADLKFGDGICLWVFGRCACVLDWRNAILNDYAWESDGFDFGLYRRGVSLMD
jgi:hypothetical protein